MSPRSAHNNIPAGSTLLMVLVVLSACTAAEPTSEAIISTPRVPSAALSATPWPTTPEPTQISSEPVTYLADLTPVSSQGGAIGVGVFPYSEGPIQRNDPIVFRDHRYTHGIFAHADSRLTYYLDQAYTAFRARLFLAGYGEGMCGDGSRFRVIIDGTEVYASPAITYSGDPVDVELDVTGSISLSLVTDSGGSGDYNCDWAVWGDPYLVASAQPHASPQIEAVTCPGSEPGRAYVFLDCDDIRRIRREIAANEDTALAWRRLAVGVAEFTADLPTTYTPQTDSPWMWYFFMPRNIGLAYLVSGNEHYAQALVQLLTLIRDGTPAPIGEGGRPESGLTVMSGHFTSSYIAMLFAYSTVRNTSLLDDMDRSAFDSYFIEQGRRLEAYSTWQRGSDLQSMWNQFIQADAAIATIALALPDDPSSPGLLDRARRRLEARIANWYDADGGYREYADNYSPLVLQALLLWAETEFHASNDVYARSYQGVTLHRMCQWYLNVMTPQGLLPAINDGHPPLQAGLLRLCAIRAADPTLTYAFERYSDGLDLHGDYDFILSAAFDTVAWSASDLPLREPTWASALLPDSGLAVLRSGWHNDAQYVLLEFTDDGLDHPMHLHQAFGNIVLHDAGPWILENGYRANTDEEWLEAQSTAHHSTLTLDNLTQTNTRANRTFFHSLGPIGVASASAQTYPALSHTRTILWSESWHQWVVVDDAALSTAPQGHSLQLRWYVSIPSELDRLRSEHTSLPGGERWSFERSWATPATLAIDLFPGSQASFMPMSRIYLEPWLGRAEGIEVEISPASRLTRMVSVLTSTVNGMIPASSIARDDTDEATQISTQQGDLQLDWVYPHASSATSRIGEYTVTGRAACQEQDGNSIISYCLFDGTQLVRGGISLVAAPDPVSAYASILNGVIVVNAHDACTIQLLWPSGVASIRDETGFPTSYSISGSQLAIHVSEGTHTYTVSGADALTDQP